mgnify:CR=1 FL=1
MPEKMTEEEARISRAIRLVRKAKETIKLVGSSTELPYDDEVEDVKVKRPKAEKYDENQKKEGYGMGGETIGKAESNYTTEDRIADDFEDYYLLIKEVSKMLNEMESKVKPVRGEPKNVPVPVEKLTSKIKKMVGFSKNISMLQKQQKKESKYGKRLDYKK